MTQSPQIASLDHFVLTVADIPTTLAFYSEVLGMQAETFQVADGSHRHSLKFGPSKINLHQRGHEFEPKARHPTPGSADLCFLSEVPLSDWQVHLRTRGIRIEEGPLPRTGARGPIVSIYLRDPDGNLIEISNSQ